MFMLSPYLIDVQFNCLLHTNLLVYLPNIVRNYLVLLAITISAFVGATSTMELFLFLVQSSDHDLVAQTNLINTPIDRLWRLVYVNNSKMLEEITIQP